MKNYKDIENLLDRFFDGQTSNEEERMLYDFFTGKEIPEHLVRYKPVFCYFETQLEEELIRSVQSHDTTIKPRKYHWIKWAGVAASLFLLVVFTPYILKKTDTFNPYEGSYIVRNGQRITDPEIIRPALEAAVREALSQQEKAEQLLMCLTEKADEPGLIEQQIQEQLDELINNVQDQQIREIVKEIVQTK